MRSSLMYNEKQKLEYIAFENKNSKNLTDYFKRVAPKEYEYGKDIVDMDYDEIKNTIASLNIRREESRGHLISLLRGYANWASIYEKTNNGNIINSITPESINSQGAIKQQMLKSPDQLREILNNTLDYKDYENRSKRDTLVCWLLYFGMTLTQLTSLKKNNLHYENKTITTKEGVKYQISDEIADLWKYCAEMTYIEKKNGRIEALSVKQVFRKQNVNEYIHYNLVDNQYLFRPIEGNKTNSQDEISINTLMNIIQKIFNKKEDSEDIININPTNIRTSGIFYRLYLLEKDGLEITPEVIAKHLDIKYKDRDELMLKTRRWRIDYADWRLTFNYVI